MPSSMPRRDRLQELLALAQAYRGWNNRKLAEFLGRDPSNLVPESGVPKLDLVIRLAEALDWPVEDVVRDLCSAQPGPIERLPVNKEFKALDAAAYAAYERGDYEGMVSIAKQAYDVARTAEERARACNREAGGWDGMGRHNSSLEATQKGLKEVDASLERRLRLRVNLANAYYMLGQLYEGKGLATDLIEWFAKNPPDGDTRFELMAFARYVRGNCLRLLADAGNEESLDVAAAGRDDLVLAQNTYRSLGEKMQLESYLAIANTCQGAIMELHALLGERTGESVIEEIVSGLEAMIDLEGESAPKGPWLESFGWWCIFGCNVALRHMTDERRLQQCMAVFTNKADEIAEKLGNWALRERVLTMEYERRRRLGDWTGVESDWVMDREDLRTITGTMGRFPSFRGTAWRILRAARVIRDEA
jgi:hypothetical protein